MPSVSAGRRDGVAANPIRRGARAARSNFGLAGTRFGATSVWKVAGRRSRCGAGSQELRRRPRDRGLARTGGVLSEATVRPTTQAAPSIMRTPANVKASSARRAERSAGPRARFGRAPVARCSCRSSSCACGWNHRSRWNGRGNQRNPRPIFAELCQDRVHGGRPLIRFLRQHWRHQVGQPSGHIRGALFE